MAPFGLLRVNGQIIRDPGYHLQPGDFLSPEEAAIRHFRPFFHSHAPGTRDRMEGNRFGRTGLPANIKPIPGVRGFIYLRHPKEEDLPLSSRLIPHLFR